MKFTSYLGMTDGKHAFLTDDTICFSDGRRYSLKTEVSNDYNQKAQKESNVRMWYNAYINRYVLPLADIYAIEYDKETADDDIDIRRRLDVAEVDVEAVCECDRLAFGEVGTQTIVPLERFVAVERIASTDADTFEELILLHQSAYLLEMGHSTLIPFRVVCLVEGGYAHHVVSFGAAIVYRGLEELNPFSGFSYVVSTVLCRFFLPSFGDIVTIGT